MSTTRVRARTRGSLLVRGPIRRLWPPLGTPLWTPSLSPAQRTPYFAEGVMLYPGVATEAFGVIRQIWLITTLFAGGQGGRGYPVVLELGVGPWTPEVRFTYGEWCDGMQASEVVIR